MDLPSLDADGFVVVDDALDSGLREALLAVFAGLGEGRAGHRNGLAHEAVRALGDHACANRHVVARPFAGTPLAGTVT